MKHVTTYLKYALPVVLFGTFVFLNKDWKYTSLLFLLCDKPHVVSFCSWVVTYKQVLPQNQQWNSTMWIC